MTLSEAAAAAESLALSLEAAVPLCTTRIEHIRVSGHAYQARTLANTLHETLQAASRPREAPGVVFSVAAS